MVNIFIRNEEDSALLDEQKKNFKGKGKGKKDNSNFGKDDSDSKDKKKSFKVILLWEVRLHKEKLLG